MPTGSLSLDLTIDGLFGTTASSNIPNLILSFALNRQESVATAAAGAELARQWGGHWNGQARHVTMNFQVVRPARLMAFDRPGLLAGFRFDQLLVRFSDFPGDKKLPVDPSRADEVVISKRLPHQQAVAAIALGEDRLSRCAEIVYTAIPRTLTLRCAFD